MGTHHDRDAVRVDDRRTASAGAILQQLLDRLLEVHGSSLSEASLTASNQRRNARALASTVFSSASPVAGSP
jgi:hypothetical protein